MTARLFVAAWPPQRVLDHLGLVERPVVPGLRWTTRAQWHVTLRFLGSCDEAAAADALAAIAASAADAVAGPSVQRLGRQHLVLPVAGLASLAAAAALAFRGLGVEQAERAFRGHLTLARARRALPSGALSAAARSMPPVAKQWEVTELALVASTLRQEGSAYTTLAVVALDPRVPSGP